MKTGIDLFTARARNRLLWQMALAALIVFGAPPAAYFAATAITQWQRGEPIEPLKDFKALTPGRLEIPEGVR